MRVAGRIEQTLHAVAHRTAAHAYRCWGFGEAIAMRGLLAAARATGDHRYRDAVEASFASWWSRRDGHLTFEDHVAPGVPLLLLARDDARWMPVALGLGGLYRRFPHQHGVAVHRPDLAAWATHVWVDCLYTDGGFLALLARMTGDRTWEDLACSQTLAYLDVLLDAQSGLFFHGYDTATGRANQIRWGRGNGWALLGLLDLVRFMRADHPSRLRLAEVVRRQVETIVAVQDAGGHWHTILDRPDTYLESSVAAMMAWALPQAVRLRLASDAVLPAAEAALAAALAATDAGGNLTGVSEATPAGDAAIYTTRPTGVFPWGQGPLLLALADLVAPGSLWEDIP